MAMFQSLSSSVENGFIGMWCYKYRFIMFLKNVAIACKTLHSAFNDADEDE